MSGGHRGRLVGVGRLPDDPTGRVAGPDATDADATRDSCAPSIARDGPPRLPDGTGRQPSAQPCRNRTARSARPVAARRPGATPDTGSPRRRSPGRGAARPTAPTRSIVTSAGSRPPGRAARTSSRNASTSGLIVWRIDEPLDRALADELDQPLARLGPGPDLVDGLDHAVLDRMIGLTESSVPIAAWAPLIRPPFLRYSRVSRATYIAHVRRARLEDLGDLGGRPALGGQLHAHPGQDPLAHRGAQRVDDVDLAVGQHVAGDLGALDRARQRAGDVDRDDRLGAGREGRLVGLLEVAGRRGGGRRERRVRRDHPLPERLGREVRPRP